MLLRNTGVGYFPEAEKKLSNFPFYIQTVWRSIMRNAASISVVSMYLGQCLEKILPGIAFTVIPNVVDTSIFKPAVKEKNKTVSFIHISLLNYQKNADDIIRAMSIFEKGTFAVSVIHFRSPEWRFG